MYAFMYALCMYVLRRKYTEDYDGFLVQHDGPPDGLGARKQNSKKRGKRKVSDDFGSCFKEPPVV